MKRTMGSVRSRSQRPDMVMKPLRVEAQDGIHSMMENAIPSVCTQSGSEVKCRWCGPAHMYMNTSDQKDRMDSR